MKNIFHLKFLLIFFVLNQIILSQSNKFFIRLNQVGYLPDDFKSGVIISENEIPTKNFSVINKDDNTIVYSGIVETTEKIFGKFIKDYKKKNPKQR